MMKGVHYCYSADKKNRFVRKSAIAFDLLLRTNRGRLSYKLLNGAIVVIDWNRSIHAQKDICEDHVRLLISKIFINFTTRERIRLGSTIVMELSPSVLSNCPPLESIMEGIEQGNSMKTRKNKQRTFRRRIRSVCRENAIIAIRERKYTEQYQ